ncbi:MAG: TetR/AcrR family transcriptional regulator [Eubacteriales bacterium]|nr:TetR/AcrR family transcriptional regulator [Eubacteriales bacterium]
MNEKFFNLSQEKQQRIINAGYRVFSQNNYKKSPVGEVAAEAGISKSLLFHYFRNKKELYLFLWDEAGRLTLEALEEEGCYEHTDLFEMMNLGFRAKMKLMRGYPDLTGFVMKAFYEKEPEIASAIQERYAMVSKDSVEPAFKNLRYENFRPDLDFNMIIREMFLATEGYLWEELQKGELDLDKMERDFKELLVFWKKVYTVQVEAEE